MPKVLLIGWDAADWKVIHPLMDAGRMPGLKMLVEHGTIADLATLEPVLSPMLWTSIATGKRARKHGIYGFSEPDPATGGIRPISNLSRRTKALWNILNQQGLRSHVIGWWPSQPAEPINGVMVSNQFHHSPREPGKPWPLLPESIHPAEWTERLLELRVHPEELTADVLEPFIPDLQAIDLDKDKRPLSVARVLAEATTVQAVATTVIDEPWDFMAVYFDAIDHFGHGFMKYHPPRQSWIKEDDFERYRHVVETGYVYHDIMLQALLNKIDPNETVIMLVSDHGFHPDHLRPQALPDEPAGPAAEHREHGVFLVAGPGIKRDHLLHGASLLDVAPTVLSLFGLPVGEDMDGEVLTDIYQTPPRVERIPSWDAVPGDDAMHPPDKQMSAEDSREAIAQLVDLGYIDAPDADQSAAIAKTTRELDYNLARSLLHEGRALEAVELFERLWGDWPLEHRFGVRLAYCYQLLGQRAEQRRVVEALMQRRREEMAAAQQAVVEFHQVLAARRAEQGAGQGGGAEALDIPDDAEDVPQSISDLMTEQEREQYRKLRAKAQRTPAMMHYLMGQLLFDEGRYDQALAHLEQARRPDAKAVQLNQLVGQTYLEMARLDDAKAAFERVLASDPHHPEATLGLCRLALARRDHRRAAELALKTIGLRFHYPFAHHLLGVALVELNQPQRAARAFNVALEQNPSLLESHRQLEQLYANALHDPAKADEHGRAIEEITAQMRRQQARPAAPIAEVDGGSQIEPVKPDPAPVEAPDQAAAGTDEQRPSHIVVVSGLPRSGTSMMMQMLDAGGVPTLSDGQRTADQDNPKGYYEYERAKQLHQDRSWLPEADGKAVKLIAQLLPSLPPRPHTYSVIFMQRPLEEVIASQRSMLEHLGKDGARLPPDKLEQAFLGQLEKVRAVLDRSGAINTLYVDYHEVLAQPAKIARRLALFLGRPVDEAAMAAVVDPALYRQRGADSTRPDADQAA